MEVRVSSTASDQPRKRRLEVWSVLFGVSAAGELPNDVGGVNGD
jgi:hypothetical protein